MKKNKFFYFKLKFNKINSVKNCENWEKKHQKVNAA